VCARKLAAERAAQVVEVVERERAAGREHALLTLTVAHNRCDPLCAVFDTVAEAWRRLNQGSGRWLAKGRACIRAMDLSWSPVAGWHAHLHVLTFGDIGEPAELLARWKACVGAAGGPEAVPSDEHGLRVSKGRPDYLARLGLELGSIGAAKRAARGHFAPWQLAHEVAKGKAWAAELWREYAEATYGRRQLTWSRGLRPETETPDEPEPVIVATLTPRMWTRANLKTRGRVLVELGAFRTDQAEQAIATIRRYAEG
jgi:hypothetical protein